MIHTTPTKALLATTLRPLVVQLSSSLAHGARLIDHFLHQEPTPQKMAAFERELRTLLQEVPEDGLNRSRMLIPITEMREGMVLAEDLYTASGLKLLSKEAPLNSATLQIILSRHRTEPILHGAVVHRP